MLHVLFSISSFIQVSNNEARKCEWKYTKYNHILLYIQDYSVYTLYQNRYNLKTLAGLSAQTKERAVFGWKTGTRSSLDDGLSIVYTEAEIRRSPPFLPSKHSDLLEAQFVPIISVKIFLHILVKSKKCLICQFSEKNNFCFS